MKTLSVRWLLLGVAAASLLLPALGLLVLRFLDPYLVQQTERQLQAEGALIGESYRNIWAEMAGKPLGNPRPPNRQRQSFIAVDATVRSLNDLEPPLPLKLPVRVGTSNLTRAARKLSESLRAAQIYNLSGVRVLDANGCAVASSREQLDVCFHALPEVAQALRGKFATVLRSRTSDEPPPPIGSVRRRGDVRVFVARPVFDDGQVVGAVWLSRTAETGLEFLFKQRRELFFGGLLLMLTVIVVSASFAMLIIRPLRAMAASASALAVNDAPPPLGAIPAPKEIHELGVAFDLLTEKLQARARYVADFAANVSHELKTPLTSIRGALELLRDEQATMEPAQRERFLANMDAAAERTERLVSRLLLLARLENRQEADRTELTRLGDWLESRARDWGEKVAVEADGLALSSKLSSADLDAIVGNLLDNALRYRRAKPVELAFSCRATEFRIRCADDGAGISQENQSRVFTRFFTTERDRGGTGLGLSIVRAVAQANGGDASIHSGPDGTQVHVYFRTGFFL